jgi:multidrug efflux pump
MISRFFIDRPIFATVLSVLITLTGAIALSSLPVAQYPPITPPSVQVSISYPGASAQVVADTVAAPIEQQVNGVPGMLYMSSQSGNDGSYTLSVTFDVGTNLNTALVMVQNRVTLAMPLLPSQVQNQGITIRKKTPDILMVVSFFAPDRRYDDIYLSNFVLINLKDELLRVDGVSDVSILGERDYSIRVWLDPQKLAARNMSANDVVNAIRTQNIEAAPGQVGSPPTSRGQFFQMPIDTLGRLDSPEQFSRIVVKVGQSRPAGQATAMARQSGQSNTALPNPGTLSPGGTTPAGTTPAATATGSTTNGAAASSAATAGTTGVSGTGGYMTSGPGTAGVGSSSGGYMTTGGGTTGGGATGGGATGGGATGSAGSTTPAASSTGSGLTSNLTSSLATGGGTGVIPGAKPGSKPQPPSSSIVWLRDVARVEMGALNYNQSCTFDGQPSVGMAIFQLPGTNALEVADRVRKRLDELKSSFPPGIEYLVAYDTTPFISESVADVVRTLFEAVALVGMVVLVFLQNWRTVLIPMVAVPVAIVGTFAVMAVVGFSLNNISLFGLVLAIGIVVDDAIVVVENVERWLARGLPPREAAVKAMEEVTGPVIAVALVLCAVFVPCAFISGITGRFFRQFAVTIAVSTVFSAINSLTLSPALAVILMRPHTARRDPVAGFLHLTLGWFFRLFNGLFGAGTAGYGWLVGRLLRLSAIVLVGYGALLFLTFWLFEQAPTGFIPQQDQGRAIASVQLPDSASLQRTMKTMALVEKIAHETPGVAHTIGIAGMSFVQQASGPNFGSMFIVLEPHAARRSLKRREEWTKLMDEVMAETLARMPDDDRRRLRQGWARQIKNGLSDVAIMSLMRQAWNRKVKDGVATVFGAPPVPGLSVAGGFKLIIEDRGGLGLESLDPDRKLAADIKPMGGAGGDRRPSTSVQTPTGRLLANLRQDPRLTGVSTPFRSNIPQLYMDIDRTKAAALGVAFQDLNQALLMYLGSLYVNSFNDFGRHWQVTVQAEGKFRRRISDVNFIQVRNQQGDMVPLGTLVRMREIGGPIFVTRYNLSTAAPVTGSLAPGVSTGDVIAATDRLAYDTLPRSMKTEWTELMFMQIRAGNTTGYVFALAIMCVFLALSSLYESWSLPLAVILVVPLCMLFSIAGVLFVGDSVNIFVQIGLVVLVGLACKNAILIVEFAKQLHQEGKSRFEATQEASRLRLRPILMTSLAFILGVVPLVVAQGAGAEMRRSLGTAVFSGMLGVTLFGIFLTPVFFYVIQGVDTTRLSAHPLTRWLLSCSVGGLLGLATGFLVSQISGIGYRWTLPASAATGVVLAVMVLSIHGRLRK